MADNWLRDSDSDMDMDMEEESEDELNITTYFHDTIEESSIDSDSSERESLEDGGRLESPEEKVAVDLAVVSINVVESGDATASSEVVGKSGRLHSDVDYTEVPMDIISSPESSELVAKSGRFNSDVDNPEVPMGTISSPESSEVVGKSGRLNSDVDYTEVPMDIMSPTETKATSGLLHQVCGNELPEMVVGGGTSESSEVVGENGKLSSDVNYTEVPMNIMSPPDTKKSHSILCPVCYEIAILCKNSSLYDNLINECMKQRSKQ